MPRRGRRPPTAVRRPSATPRHKARRVGRRWLGTEVALASGATRDCRSGRGTEVLLLRDHPVAPAAVGRGLDPVERHELLKGVPVPVEADRAEGVWYRYCGSVTWARTASRSWPA